LGNFEPLERRIFFKKIRHPFKLYQMVIKGFYQLLCISRHAGLHLAQ
jgi:hypothetical protein